MGAVLLSLPIFKSIFTRTSAFIANDGATVMARFALVEARHPSSYVMARGSPPPHPERRRRISCRETAFVLPSPNVGSGAGGEGFTGGSLRRRAPSTTP